MKGTYTFSDNLANMKPSAIREILKRTADPSIIPFSAGNPAAEAFPVEDVRRITAQVLGESPVLALQYSVSEGYSPLRKLSQGYSYVTAPDGSCVTQVGQVSLGEMLGIRVQDGVIHAAVKEIEEREPEIRCTERGA